MKAFKVISAIVFLVLIGDYFFPLVHPYGQDLEKGREAAAIQTLRSMHNAQAQFKTCRGRFGTLQELASIGFLDARYAGGNSVARFVYSDENVSAETYCIKANRWKDKAGPRDFNVIEDGEIRFEESTTLCRAVCGKGTRLSEAPDVKQ